MARSEGRKAAAAHQLDVRPKLHLRLAWEACNLPDQAGALRLILGLAAGDGYGGARGVAGHGHANDDARGCERRVKARGAHFDGRLDARAPNLTDERHDFEWQRDVIGDAVLHELELAVRGHKRNSLLRRKARQVNALVKRYVVQLDRFAAHRRAARRGAQRRAWRAAWRGGAQGSGCAPGARANGAAARVGQRHAGRALCRALRAEPVVQAKLQLRHALHMCRQSACLQRCARATRGEQRAPTGSTS